MLLSVFLIVSLYLTISILGDEDSLYWPDWYILRLGPGTDIKRVEETLRELGVEETISGASAEVTYMAIPNLERVSVANLEEYLTPGDPRRDPYISSVSRFFESDGSPLVYIRAKHRLSHYKRILERQEEISDWHLMDWRGIRTLLESFILIAVTMLVALFGSTSGRRLARFGSIIPLAVFTFLITPNTVIPIILAFYLSPIALSAESKAYTHRIVIYIGYALALVSIFLTYDEKYLSLLAVLVSELVYLVLAGVNRQLIAERIPKKDELPPRGASKMRKTLNHEHQLFNPIPLSQIYRVSMPGDFRRTVFNANRIRKLLLAVPVLLIFLIPEPIPVNHGPLPYARRSAEDFENIKAMELLDMTRNPTDLPDIALLMASTAYQEGFPFGAVFRLPRLGESLVIRDYSQVGNTIESVETTVIEYNQAWYRHQLSAQLESGLGRLFASLNGPSPVLMVERQPIGKKSWGDFSTTILWVIAFIAIFILALIPHDAKMRNSARSLPGGGRTRAA